MSTFIPSLFVLRNNLASACLAPAVVYASTPPYLLYSECMSWPLHLLTNQDVGILREDFAGLMQQMDLLKVRPPNACLHLHTRVGSSYLDLTHAHRLVLVPSFKYVVPSENMEVLGQA